MCNLKLCSVTNFMVGSNGVPMVTILLKPSRSVTMFVLIIYSPSGKACRLKADSLVGLYKQVAFSKTDGNMEFQHCKILKM